MDGEGPLSLLLVPYRFILDRRLLCYRCNATKLKIPYFRKYSLAEVENTNSILIRWK